VNQGPHFVLTRPIRTRRGAFSIFIRSTLDTSLLTAAPTAPVSWNMSVPLWLASMLRHAALDGSTAVIITPAARPVTPIQIPTLRMMNTPASKTSREYDRQPARVSQINEGAAALRPRPLSVKEACS